MRSRPSRIVLYGWRSTCATSTRSRVLLASRPGIPITLVTDAVRAIDDSVAPGLLADWVRRGVRLATSEEVMTG
jgi:hypothetical protein